MSTLDLIIGGLGIPMMAIAALLAIIRIARGPSIIDRVVAADVLIAVVIAGLVLEAVIHRHATTVPVVLALSLVGFAGSVSVAQLVAGREASRIAAAKERQQ